MHKLTSVKDIAINCNKYVLEDFIVRINYLIDGYNKDKFPFSLSIDIDGNITKATTKHELFMYIISNLPMGYQLFMEISTNYLQLKTIYNQRKNHKLDEWRYFCDRIKSLPMSELIIN